MKKTKVLLVLEATVGGAYKHVLLLAEYLSKDKFDVSLVLSPLRNPSCTVDVERLRELNVKCTYVPIRRKISLYHDLVSSYRLYKYINKESYDIIHLHSSKAGFLVRLISIFCKSTPIVYTPHCFYFQSKTRLSRLFFKKLEQATALVTNTIITLSESERKLTLKEKVINKERVVTIINALPACKKDKTISPHELREKYNVPPNTTIITGIGRLSKQKGWEIFVNIARHILSNKKNIAFLIVGDGEEYSKLCLLVKKYNIDSSVIFTGKVNCINEIYLITDIILNTSLWESTSYVLLEAMSHGLPIIATDIPGNNDIECLSVNECLFNTEDYLHGARIITKLLDNESYRKKIGMTGYEYFIGHNNFNKFIATHESVYLNRY